MEKYILNYNKQFNFNPEIINKKKLSRNYKSFLLCGMGGSHLAGDIIKTLLPKINLSIHSDYGLPKTDKKCLIIISSFSGNTEEILDTYDKIIKNGCNKSDFVIVTSGGELLKKCEKNNNPYIRLPDNKIQPRMAIGYSLRAFLKLIDSKMLAVTNKLYKELKPHELMNIAEKYTKDMRGYIPIIYSSNNNRLLTNIWKIKFNETSKIPAFCNSFPELNHNEMASFGEKKTYDLASRFMFIFIYDKNDDKKITQRMDVLYKELSHIKYPMFKFNVDCKDIKSIMEFIIIGDWLCYHLARDMNVDPLAIKMITSFKKKIK